MLTRLFSLTIVQKLNLSFVTIVVCVIGLVAFSVVSVSNLQTLYSEYREKARLSLLLSNLTGGLSNARLAVLKYRISDSQEAADAVNSSIQTIAGLKTKVIEVVTDEGQLQRLQELQGLAEQYGQAFNEATARQAERHKVVGRMDELGPDMRLSLTEIMDSAYADGDPDAAYYAGRAQQSLMLARYYARNFLIWNQLEDADRTNAEIDSAEKETQIMLKELQNPRRRELANRVITELGEYRTRFAEVVEIISQRNKFYFEGLDKVGPEILGGYTGLYSEVEDTQNKLGPETVQTMENIRNSALIVGVVIGVLALAIATLMSRAMSRSFKLAIDQMTRLSEGDKSFEIEGAERGDEIGDISRSLVVFRTNAIEVDRLAEESRKAEEREQELAKQQEKERRQAILDLANTFEDKVGGVVRDVETASVQLQEMASSLSATVGQTRSESASVATASQNASSNVQTVAAAAEEMTASIREISSNVAETATTTKNCTVSAEDSKNRLSALQKAIDEIDSVISAINDVAEQTNLLALNATIEAARAGDAGKGFAVVATEVKSLANATHKMTEEISDKVGGIKGSAQNTIESVNSIIDQITNIDERTSNVAAAIEEQSASTEEISRNVQNAASGTSSVSSSIELVQQATDNSAQSTEQLESAANQLSAQSQALNSSVEEFLSEVRAG